MAHIFKNNQKNDVGEIKYLTMSEIDLIKINKTQFI